MGRYDTNYDPNSPTEQWKRERGQLNFCMFPDQMIGPQNTNPVCECGQKFTTVPKKPGTYFCKHCGNEVPIDGKQEKKLVQKYGARGGSGGNRPVLTSQKATRKTQRVDSNEFDGDMKSDLAGFGYSPED